MTNIKDINNIDNMSLREILNLVKCLDKFRNIVYDEREIDKITISNLRSQKLKSIPKSIFIFKNLISIDFSENNITKIENLNNFKYLENLSLTDNEISKIEGLNNLQI